MNKNMKALIIANISLMVMCAGLMVDSYLHHRATPEATLTSQSIEESEAAENVSDLTATPVANNVGVPSSQPEQEESDSADLIVTEVNAAQDYQPAEAQAANLETASIVHAETFSQDIEQPEVLIDDAEIDSVLLDDYRAKAVAYKQVVAGSMPEAIPNCGAMPAPPTPLEEQQLTVKKTETLEPQLENYFENVRLYRECVGQQISKLAPANAPIEFFDSPEYQAKSSSLAEKSDMANSQMAIVIERHNYLIEIASDQ